MRWPFASRGGRRIGGGCPREEGQGDQRCQAARQSPEATSGSKGSSKRFQPHFLGRRLKDGVVASASRRTGMLSLSFARPEAILLARIRSKESTLSF
jgi:hypothetical protein